MAYEKKTIGAIINDINSGKIYLPAIQRKFVWGEGQIINLMDSIMLNYPIGTFLLWNVKKNVVNDKGYSMYILIKDYHERDKYKNPSAPSPFQANSPDDSILAVLDGQQRLTSLYIALQGSLSLKLPRKQWKNDDAFPKKEMYFNLHSGKSCEEDENHYEFSFMTEKETKESDKKLWYRVKDILQYNSQTDINQKVIMKNQWVDDAIATTNLCLLYERLKKDDLINYFEVNEDSIDNVLDIFVRVNSGGTVLSKSDLLFSTVVSQWDQAREKIDELLASINKIGEGFSFNNDFIMRACLYLLDLNVVLKVETFRKESIMAIKDKWNNIQDAIIKTVKLMDSYGFNRENIVSYLAILPMVYYVFKHKKVSSLSKSELRKYIIVAQLKQIFGAASNSVLMKIRDELKNIENDFELKKLEHLKFVADRSLKVDEDDIIDWFDTLEKGPYTFMVLSLLYPELKLGQIKFHQDHMHPYSAFENTKIKDTIINGENVSDDKIIQLQSERNKLANLQLLKDDENENKKDVALSKWLKDSKNKGSAKFVPANISTELSDCENFWKERQKLMIKQLKKILFNQNDKTICK